jgi:hypothetical protein
MRRRRRREKGGRGGIDIGMGREIGRGDTDIVMIGRGIIGVGGIGRGLDPERDGGTDTETSDQGRETVTGAEMMTTADTAEETTISREKSEMIMGVDDIVQEVAVLVAELLKIQEWTKRVADNEAQVSTKARIECHCPPQL